MKTVQKQKHSNKGRSNKVKLKLQILQEECLSKKIQIDQNTKSIWKPVQKIPTTKPKPLRRPKEAATTDEENVKILPQNLKEQFSTNSFSAADTENLFKLLLVSQHGMIK